MSKWDKITKDHVLKAIRKYDTNNPIVPAAKNTFLKYGEKIYPAKHLRGMAYEIAYNKKIAKSEYSGGKETVRFFERLGFEIIYDGQSIKQSETNLERNENTDKDNSNRKESHAKDKIKIDSKGVIEQKNEFQKVLNKYFEGDIVCEKTFSWMLTPTTEKNNIYKNLIVALHNYRGYDGFARKGYKLKCDFVCDTHKIIFEYDERQHFSHARKIALESYKEAIKLNYDVDKWIKACCDIGAKDNSPFNRDEIRAFYDSVRDIEAANNGYKLIRIMHGQFDWKSDEAEEYLKTLLSEKEESICNISRKEKVICNTDSNIRRNLKVGLYLQNVTENDSKEFDNIIEEISNENIDLLVFPEFCYTSFKDKIGYPDILNQDGYSSVKDECLELSKKAKCAIIYNDCDCNGITYSIYVNAFATENETKDCLHIKHTATEYSAFNMDYYNFYKYNFPIIQLKSVNIGMTICYDCNHALFSRIYGIKGVDLIVNSTGGNVVHSKWYRYNKVRAIENNCYNLCTMGYDPGSSNNSYTF